MQDDEQRQLRMAREDLVREFRDRLDAQSVAERFDAVVAGFDGAPVRTFVPVLAQRLARRELTDQR